MKKHQQTLEELLEHLSPIATDWKDDFSTELILFLDEFDESHVDANQIVALLEKDFEMASAAIRLFLEKSSDEYRSLGRDLFIDLGGAGKKVFKRDPKVYLERLEKLGLLSTISETMNKSYSWKDILVERLKAGRGSAIKGQKRGRAVEDFVESIVKSVFERYDVRCSFYGKSGLSTEKADIAIPSKESPSIVIEVKAYGATGSKQTDVIGDIKKIIDEKRHDTVFILVTDGVTWHARKNDLRKLVKFQNEGYIYRIYTTSMCDDLSSDLLQLKNELSL